jgi:hypothetical protein
MSTERPDEEQHEPSQRFVQQLLTASMDKENYDIIKSIPMTDPHDEENVNYNRARLQLLALQEDHASSSTATLSLLIDQLRTLKIQDFKKKGVKDSRAIVLFFQAHTNTVTRINSIAEHRQNEVQLLYNIEQNLPPKFRQCARGAKTVQDLKAQLIHEAKMHTDSVDSEEQVFTASNGDKARKDPSKNTRPKSPGPGQRVCFDWERRAYCRFGAQCRFAHKQNSSSSQWQPSYRQESRMHFRQQRNFSEGGRNARPIAYRHSDR